LTRLTTILAVLAGVLAGVIGMLWWQDHGGAAVPNRAGVERVVHDYILAHPDIVPEAMQRLQDRETGRVIADNRAAITTPIGSAWEGSAHPDVTVVEYLDFNCGYCRASLPVIQQFLASDPKVRVVYRELPVLSEASGVAARLAAAAALKGKYKPFHDALYAGGPLTDASMAAAARAAGLDPAALKLAAQDPQIAHQIEMNLQLSRALSMAGTPSWVIGNRVLSGAQSLEALQKAVADARAQG
jgi:protein-disulfide isomerase